MSKNYESPISMFEQTPMMDMRDTVDGLIISAVRRVGIDVNKEELVKALAYDRGQYEKGYKDALKEREIIYCKDCENFQTDWEPRCGGDGRHYCAVMDSIMPPDGFCNYAERREE